jgi:membrane protein YdbS with pleckstrin-like domain
MAPGVHPVVARVNGVDDLFAPPGNAWRPVSPQLRRLRRTVLGVVVAVLTVAALVVPRVFGLPLLWSVGPAVVLLLLLGYGWWLIGRQVRNWGYAERDDDLYVRHGALFRELVAVPYGRMQFVDITAGPLEQAFGVATVHLHTASPRTNAKIPGLPADEAARLRDRLTELGEAQAAGL